MGLNEIQIAQIKVCNSRRKAKELGDDARRQYMVYLAAKKLWLAEVDRTAVLEKEVDEKVAIERAFEERKRKGDHREDSSV